MKISFVANIKLAKVFILTSFLFFSIMVHSQILPDDRNYQWQGNDGVNGGIPNITTIFTSLTPSATGNDFAQIQDALLNAPSNSVVKLAPGTFTVSASFWPWLSWHKVKSGVVLRGSGPASTTIMMNGQLYMQGEYYTGDFTTAVDLTVDAVKGAYTINLTSVPSWIVDGGIYLIDQLDDTSFVAHGTPQIFEEGKSDREKAGAGARGLAQRIKVVSHTSTSVIIEMPLVYGFSTEFKAQLAKGGFNPTGFLKNCGIEDMKIVGSVANANYSAIKMEGCDGCWVRYVEGYKVQGLDHVIIFDSYRSEIRDNYFHDGFLFGGGQSYGVAIYNNSSGILVENNVCSDLHCPLQINYGSSANVIAYNFSFGGKSDARSAPSISYHGTHAYMNLIEGNYCMDKIEGDVVHGSGSHLLIFRNRVVGRSVFNEHLTAIASDYYNRRFTVLGNVLGDPGFHTVYEFIAPTSCNSSTSKSIYKLGYRNPWGCDINCVGGGYCYDIPAQTAILRLANYNVVSGFVGGGYTINDLQQSYYLTTKPNWFGNLTWPPFSPDQASLTSTIPAKYCYEQGKMPNCQSTEVINIKSNTQDMFNINIYPNPVQDKIYFENNSSFITNTNMEIFSILGRRLLNEKVNLQTDKMLDVSELSSGIYFVRLTNEKTKSNYKIVIAK